MTMTLRGSGNMDVAVNVDENTAAIIENEGGISGSLPLAGGTMTGQAVGIAPVAAGDMTRKDYVDAAIAAAIAAIPPAGGGFPTGTTMLFADAVAPLGWTLNTANDNKALRLSGAAGGGVGGTTPFTDIFSQTVVGATAITEAMMPSHSHANTASTSSSFAGAAMGTHVHGAAGVHAHDVNYGTGSSGNQATAGSSSVAAQLFQAAISAGSHDHPAVGAGTPTGTVTSTTTMANVAAGSSATHDHTISMSLAYVDIILAVKDV